MKTYSTLESGSYYIDGLTFYANGGIEHRQMLEEVEAGEAEILLYVEPILTQDEYMSKAQKVMDAQAQSMGYDSMFTAISYVGDPFKRFNDEAVSLRAYRSKVWQHSNDLMAKVLSGKAKQPTLKEYEEGLPEFKK